MENKNWKQDDTFLARWMADELTLEEKEAFEATEEGQSYMALKQASKGLKVPPYAVDEEWNKLQEENLKDSSLPKRVWFNSTVKWSVAASLILLIGAFYLLSGTHMVRAKFGEQQLAKLPDGSEVRLNSGAVLRYSKLNWLLSRKVELEGEAYFTVTEGNKFEVVTSMGSVSVLGTSFNVKIGEDKLDVTCYTGRVLVASGNIIQDLNPNMSISIEGDEILDVKLGRVAAEPAWMRGITRIRNLEFSEVIKELQRTLNIEVVNLDPTLDTIKFTGAFPNNPEMALKLVLEPLNISYSFEADKRKLTITGRNE